MSASSANPMNAILSLLRSLPATLGRMAPREKGLMVVLLLVGCGYLALAAWDWSTSEEERARDATEHHQQAVLAAKQASEAARRPGMAKQVEQLRSLSFSAATTAIARADAQAALRTMGSEAGVLDLAVTLVNTSPGATRLALQTLVVEGQFTWPSFLALCDRLAQAKQAFFADAVSVTAGRTPRFRMSLITSLVGQSS